MSTTTPSLTTAQSSSERARPPRVRDKVLGLSGIAFAAVLIPVVVIPHASLDYENTNPPKGSVITAFFHAHYALEQYQAFMHSLAALALLVFFVALGTLVRRSDPSSSTVGRLTAGAGATMSAIMLLTMALVAGTISLTGGVDGVTQGWVYNLGWMEHFKALYLLPVALIPACVVLRRTRALPAALTWPGMVLGALGFIAMAGVLSASTEFLMFPVFVLLILWILATGIVALTRGVGAQADQDLASSRSASAYIA
jgi:hypothetical protein